MEIDEAFERIFRRHWLLLIACVVMPMLIVLAVSAGSPTKWVAQTRVLISSTTPTSAQGADALTSHARAIATSPSIVGAAFKQAGITRDANHFAQHNVSVSELGTSPIVVLTVTGRTAGEAQAIATALGDQVVAFLNDVGQGGIASALTQMQARITTATNQLTTLDQQVAASPTSVSLISQATSLRGLLDSLVADYDRLLTDQATQSPARVVSAAALPGRAQSSGLAQRVALAGLLGAAVGLLVAALLETIRPTVTGSRRLARMLDAPRIGRLTPELDEAGDAAVARQVRYAAARVDVDTVVIAGVAGDLEALARRIEPHLAATAPASSPAAGPTGPGPAGSRVNGTVGSFGTTHGDALLRSTRARTRAETTTKARTKVDISCGLRVVTLAMLDQSPAGEPLLGSARMGVVIVAPRSVRRGEVNEMADLLATTGWPLLGVLEVPPARRS